MTAPKLTKAQREALENIAAGRRATFGLHGRSAYGGFAKTIASLIRHGLVTKYTWHLTDASRAALKDGAR